MRRPVLARRLGQPVQLGRGAFDQRGLEDQILGRIADQVQFGKHDQVRACRLGAVARGEHRIGIAGKIADTTG